MTKSELKTGMIVVTREGLKCMVYKNVQTTWTSHNRECDVIVAMDGSNQWNVLNDYNENMETRTRCLNRWDIVKVIQVSHPYAFINHDYEEDEQKILWKRPEKKQYTYAQLREILGEEFEVVG